MEKIKREEIQTESKEGLIEEIAEIIYRNLVESGLSEKMVARSEHGRKFSPDDYRTVEIGYETGEKKLRGGISVQPRLKKSQGDTVTPKLYRIFRDKERPLEADEGACQQAAEQIWEGVSEEYRKILYKEAIRRTVEKLDAEIEDNIGLIKSNDPEDQEAGARFLEKNKKQLREVLKLREDFYQGRVRLIIRWPHASLGAMV